jgi:RimJ/RimL family protein N-acetyltransferase
MKRNKKVITLWVFEKNIDSIQFYRKMGFVFDGKVIKKENVNQNATRMKFEI